MEQHIIAISTITKFANVQISITWRSLFKGPWGKESEFLKKVSDILKENSVDQDIKVLDFVKYKVGEGV